MRVYLARTDVSDKIERTRMENMLYDLFCFSTFAKNIEQKAFKGCTVHVNGSELGNPEWIKKYSVGDKK